MMIAAALLAFPLLTGYSLDVKPVPVDSLAPYKNYLILAKGDALRGRDDQGLAITLKLSERRCLGQDSSSDCHGVYSFAGSRVREFTFRERRDSGLVFLVTEDRPGSELTYRELVLRTEDIERILLRTEIWKPSRADGESAAGMTARGLWTVILVILVVGLLLGAAGNQ